MSTFSSLALASKPGTQAAQKCKDCGYPSAPDEGNRTSTKISTLGELKDNGQNGCSLCALIVQGLHRCLGEETLGDRGTRLKLEFGVFMSRSLDVTIFHVSETISFVVAPGMLYALCWKFLSETLSSFLGAVVNTSEQDIL